jgi:hypothetical protein
MVDWIVLTIQKLSKIPAFSLLSIEENKFDFDS